MATKIVKANWIAARPQWNLRRWDRRRASSHTAGWRSSPCRERRRRVAAIWRMVRPVVPSLNPFLFGCVVESPPHHASKFKAYNIPRIKSPARSYAWPDGWSVCGWGHHGAGRSPRHARDPHQNGGQNGHASIAGLRRAGRRDSRQAPSRRVKSSADAVREGVTYYKIRVFI